MGEEAGQVGEGHPHQAGEGGEELGDQGGQEQGGEGGAEGCQGRGDGKRLVLSNKLKH